MNDFQAPTLYNDPSIVAAAETSKARIQAAYIMAIQKPRNFDQSRDRILQACKRTEFAGRAEFSKPQGKRQDSNGQWVTNYITGPSIRFAELALREWGNVLTEVQMLYEDSEVRRIRVSALDLETNCQFSKDVQIKRTVERQSKHGRDTDVIGERKNSYNKTVYILRATDEEMYTKEAAWISKIIRNEGLRLIPTDIIEEGMDIARQTTAQKVSQDPEGEKKKLLDSFSGLGVKPKDLEEYIKQPLDSISPAQLKDLRGVYTAIRDGDATWADYMQKESSENENAKDLTEKIKNGAIKTDKKQDPKTDSKDEKGPIEIGTELSKRFEAGDEKLLKLMQERGEANLPTGIKAKELWNQLNER